MTSMTLQELRSLVRDFVEEREWTPFHTPKNLAMTLSVEAAEVLEHFLWLTPEESAALSAEKREAVAHELADVLLVLTRLADRLDVDLAQAFRDKMVLNRAKYPVEKVRGKALKYTELPADDSV